MNGWRDWLNAIGAAFNLVGVLLAIHGVVLLKRDLFGKWQTPLGKALGRVGHWFRRCGSLIRRLTGRSHPTVHEVPIIASVATAVTLDLVVHRQHPETYDPSPKWNRYLEKRIDDLFDRMERVSTQQHERLGEVASDLRQYDEGLQRQIDARHDRLLAAIAGRDGKGLDAAWWGLMIVCVGTAMQLATALFPATNLTQ